MPAADADTDHQRERPRCTGRSRARSSCRRRMRPSGVRACGLPRWCDRCPQRPSESGVSTSADPLVGRRRQSTSLRTSTRPERTCRCVRVGLQRHEPLRGEVDADLHRQAPTLERRDVTDDLVTAMESGSPTFDARNDDHRRSTADLDVVAVPGPDEALELRCQVRLGRFPPDADHEDLRRERCPMDEVLLVRSGRLCHRTEERLEEHQLRMRAEGPPRQDLPRRGLRPLHDLLDRGIAEVARHRQPHPVDSLGHDLQFSRPYLFDSLPEVAGQSDTGDPAPGDDVQRGPDHDELRSSAHQASAPGAVTLRPGSPRARGRTDRPAEPRTTHPRASG